MLVLTNLFIYFLKVPVKTRSEKLQPHLFAGFFDIEIVLIFLIAVRHSAL
jgi:hypothetical protein